MGGVEADRTFRFGTLVARPDSFLGRDVVCNAVEEETVHGDHGFSPEGGDTFDAWFVGKVACGGLQRKK